MQSAQNLLLDFLEGHRLDEHLSAGLPARRVCMRENLS